MKLGLAHPRRRVPITDGMQTQPSINSLKKDEPPLEALLVHGTLCVTVQDAWKRAIVAAPVRTECGNEEVCGNDGNGVDLLLPCTMLIAALLDLRRASCLHFS